jgi:hypothetical protein
MSTDFHAAITAFRQIIKLADDPRNLTEIKQVAHQILLDAGAAERKTFNPVPEELRGLTDKLVIRVPMEIIFSEGNTELEEREDEEKATDEQIAEYLNSGAIICDWNTEDYDQLTGASIESMSLKSGQMAVIRPR